ncbi:MAG: hypothetical protein KZQ77_04100 [Candidatus Thiodiazotropha sp. (ex Notomyrtea botanica)]|nr:hypothetical protein [Candidatus Thiodiazotropha sp. (ex Notomyrtea botanica)]
MNLSAPTKLSDNNIEKFQKKTHKELFLDDMHRIIPWQYLIAAIEAFYSKLKGVDLGRFADKDDTHAFSSMPEENLLFRNRSDIRKQSCP